jgi:hypothetical protein
MYHDNHSNDTLNTEHSSLALSIQKFINEDDNNHISLGEDNPSSDSESSSLTNFTNRASIEALTQPESTVCYAANKSHFMNG